MVRYKKGDPFTTVSWDEAIRFASSKLMEIREKHGPDSIFVSGCARGPGNEANYVAQKFARAVVGTNNVDCCAASVTVHPLPRWKKHWARCDEQFDR